MHNIRQRLYQITAFIEDYILEPILFPFALFIIFTQLWQLILLPEPFATTFGEVLVMDFITSPVPYIVFLAIYVWWIVSRIRQRREYRDTKENQQQIIILLREIRDRLGVDVDGHNKSNTDKL